MDRKKEGGYFLNGQCQFPGNFVLLTSSLIGGSEAVEASPSLETFGRELLMKCTYILVYVCVCNVHVFHTPTYMQSCTQHLHTYIHQHLTYTCMSSFCMHCMYIKCTMNSTYIYGHLAKVLPAKVRPLHFCHVNHIY